MSFSDEVDAIRAANATRGADVGTGLELSEAHPLLPAEIAFMDEVRDLWREVDAYWRANNMVDASMAWWVEHGGRGGEGLTGEAPLPFPKVGTFVPGRTRMSWQSAASTPIEQLAAQQPTKHVAGLSINGWFAICAPGELRELLPDDQPSDYDVVSDVLSHGARGLKASFERSLRWNYFQRAGAPGGQESRRYDDVSWFVEFEGPSGLPNIRLVCSLGVPIEVFTADRSGWKSEGTLRQLVITALAGRMA